VGRRIDLAVPEDSLLLKKSIGAVPHSGGRRFTPDSESFTTLLKWIQAGAPNDAADEMCIRDSRRTAREALEDHFKAIESNPAQLDAMNEFYQQAYKMISSAEARKAFSLDGEPDAMAKLYGEYKNPRGGQPISIGRQLMLARRLVEAGVRLVTVQYHGTEGWDCLLYTSRCV